MVDERVIPTPVTWADGDIPSYLDMQLAVENQLEYLLNPPLLRLRQTVIQSMANGATVAIIWDNLEVETDNFWDAAQPTKITPSIAGWYLGTIKASWLANATGYRQVEIQKNSSATDRAAKGQYSAFSSGITGEFAFLESFNGTTDFIVANAFQNSGGSLSSDINSLSGQPTITMRWLAAL
jgi:hypothetical protein